MIELITLFTCFLIFSISHNQRLLVDKGCLKFYVDPYVDGKGAWYFAGIENKCDYCFFIQESHFMKHFDVLKDVGYELKEDLRKRELEFLPYF